MSYAEKQLALIAAAVEELASAAPEEYPHLRDDIVISLLAAITTVLALSAAPREE